ncbi:MAG: response regulator [Lachnospiraceae bacterium]|nr:response regulator [Lachnospiraceae bacterium]
MEKVLVVGKLDDYIKDLHEYISKRFTSQFSSENPSVFEGMMKVLDPDAVVLYLRGVNSNFGAVFEELQDYYSHVPVITIGTEDEKQDFEEYYTSGQFENLNNPSSSKTVVEHIADQLGIEVPELKEGEVEKKKVLIVDDNAATLRNLKSILDDSYEVSLATSGLKAINAISKKKPDLILLDYEMPVCNGKQTLEMIRADEEIKDIPVIFLTSVNNKENIHAVLLLRPAGYLLKPVKTDILKNAILKALAEADKKDT